MVNQKPISLKIGFDTLERLDAECQTGWRKRNSHINEAIEFYLEYLDTIRRIRAYGFGADRERIFLEFQKKWFPMMG